MQRILTIAGILFGITNSYATVWTDCNRVFKTVTVPSPAEIDYKSGVGKEFREALAGRTDINWNAVRDNYREWSEHTTTLNGPARLLVACVLTVLTQGMGSEWLAGQGIAEGTAMQRALGAGIDAVVASAGTALAGNLGDIGKAFDELTSAASLKSLAATMVTAGTSLSLSNALNLPQSPETFTETLKSNTVAGLVRTGVDSAIIGGNVGQNLAKNMTSSAVDSTSAQLAHGIGSAHAEGKLGPLSHKLAHAGLGAASAALTGGDATAGAIGATVSETIAEIKKQSAVDRALEKTLQTACNADRKLSKVEFNALLRNNLDTEIHHAVLTGQLAGASVAFLMGSDVGSAYQTAKNATEHNFALTIAVAVGAGAALIAANVYDYYQAYVGGGWNAVKAKWDEERALDTSLVTAGAGVGMSLGPVGSAIGATSGAIIGNASLRAKSIVQRSTRGGARKTGEVAEKNSPD